MKYPYIQVSLDWIIEQKVLTLETRIESFNNDVEINNPTWNNKAYFYWISIDWNKEQITNFKPWEDWYQFMTKEEAQEFLDNDINQILKNYNITI